MLVGTFNEPPVIVIWPVTLVAVSRFVVPLPMLIGMAQLVPAKVSVPLPDMTKLPGAVPGRSMRPPSMSPPM